MGLTLSNTNGGNGRLRLSGGTGRMNILAQVAVIPDDAQLFIQNAGITDPTQQNAIIALVDNLKTYGIWTKMKALYPFVGGTATQHKFNLKNPLDTDAAFRLVFNGGWTHSTDGALPNGTNAYANTFLNPFTHLTGYSQHVSMYSRTQNILVSGVQMGCFVSATNSEMNLYQYYNAVNFKGGSSYEYPTYAVTVNNQNTLGLQINSRTANNAFTLHFNGSLLQTNTVVETKTRPNQNMYLGASNWGGGTNATQFTPHQNAFSSIGDGLTDTEAANFYTSVQIFQTTLGRHVGVPIVSDPDAQAFLNAAVITNATQATAVNTLVTSLKGYGIWTKVDVLYPFVGGTATQHKFNLKDPRDLDAAFRLTFSGGWTHSSNGIQGNDASSYATTYLNPYTKYSSNPFSRHFSTYSRTNIPPVGSGLYFIDFAVGYDWFLFNTVEPDAIQTYGIINNAYAVYDLTSNGFDTLGLSVVSTISNSSTSLYRNSTKLIEETAVSVASLPNGPTLFGGDGASSEAPGKQYAFATIGTGLTDAEVTNYNTAVQAFQTTLGRQV